jgi:hypothetical protein
MSNEQLSFWLGAMLGFLMLSAVLAMEIWVSKKLYALVRADMLSSELGLYVIRLIAGRAVEAQDVQQPPQFAQHLLFFLLLEEERDPFLGDLEEGYHDISRRRNHWRACAWYCEQVKTSIRPLLIRAAKKFIKRVILTWLGDVIRRIIP